MNKKRWIVILCAIAAVWMVGIGAFLAFRGNSGNDYMTSISRGQKYLEEGKYDDAIVAFQAAIKKDASRTDAYEGLTRAYQLAGYETLAKEALVQGIQKTQSVSLRLQMASMFGDNSYLYDTKEVRSLSAAENKGSEGSEGINQTLLTFLAGADYGQYDKKYQLTRGSVSGTTYSYQVEDLHLVLYFDNGGSNNRINQSTGYPYSEFMPDWMSVTDLTYLFGSNEEMTADKVKAMAGVTSFTQAEDSITFEAGGCSLTISVDETGKIAANAANTIRVLELKEEGERAALEGRVVDAVDGQGVADALVSAYEGTRARGEAIRGRTNSDGTYSLEVKPGDYYVLVEKEGYITGTFDVTVLANASVTSQEFSISQELAEDEIRIVLTWGTSPRDLDSYLQGTASDGSQINSCYYSRKQKNSSGKMVAELDLDDTDGEGPETTTLYDMGGSFEFVVVDFTASGTMSSSGAQVWIYKGSSLVETIHVPQGIDNVWSVARIEQGEIQVTNEAKRVDLHYDNKR